jgi:succinyl-CoA synthetase alpha subunit
MAIIIDEKTKIVVQGITGNQGSFHASQMKAYGSRVVAGTSPGKGGTEVDGIPVYDTVQEAADKRGANASILFVPAAFAKDAAFESIAAGIKVVVVVTEGVPVHDTFQILAYARGHGATVVGPNTFGLITPGKCKIGIMPNAIYSAGPVGVIARSGTLSYEIVHGLTSAGLGQTTVVGLGGDRAVGLSFVDVLRMMEADDDTKAIVLVGEIGGSAEEEAAAYVRTSVSKPVVAFIAGRSAPPGKRMGHAGAIIERGAGTFEGKMKAMRFADIAVADFPWQVAELMRKQRM